MPKKEAPPPRPWTEELEADLQRILTVGEECISSGELKKLILAKGRGTEKYADGDEDGGAAVDVSPRIRLYDGFEPSGRMHIAQGLLKSVNVNKCTADGTHATFCFWVADWFALMNDKMGGDLAKIVTVGKYLIEVWKAAGMDLSNVEFRWASDEITDHADEYWPTMLDVARRFNVTRIKKCCQIMGRLEGSLTAAQVLYPLMQCTDVFFLKADVCQLGVDQRKVNMLAREYCDAARRKHKPVILSHHMLYGLKKGQEKMSKSDPDSAIFMEDTVEDVERKIMNAYCPTEAEEDPAAADEGGPSGEGDAGRESMQLVKDTLKNPILDYVQHIVMSPPDATFTCATASDPDGMTYSEYGDVRSDFLAGKITPNQLKRGLINSLNLLLQPVRDHFANDETARGLFEQVREFKRQSTAPETKPADEAPKVFRLDLVEKGVVKSGSHLVFAPLPNPTPTLQSAADLLAKLKAGPDGAPKVLMLLDWTARVNSACDADVKVISAYHTLLLTALRALDVHLHGESAIMPDVTVVAQSDAILADPSSYWISVINAGRHFSLDAVMGLNLGLGEGMKDAEGVGKVIGRLMLIGDVLAVNPRSVALDAVAVDAADGVGGLSLEDGGARPGSVEGHLIAEFYSAKLSHPALAGALPAPALIHGATAPNLSLQPPREVEAERLETDEYYLLDDPKVHGKSKMKKAFCEPGNVAFCPPIELLSYFGGLGDGRAVTVSRSAENGGDVSYTSRDGLVQDYRSGALHPGDLKSLTSGVMVGVLTGVSDALKSDGDAAKAAKALKAFQKKMAKQKKK